MRVIFANKSQPLIKSCGEHLHDCYEIIITTDGKSVTCIGSSCFEVKRGSIVIIPPNIKHSHKSECGFTDICIHTDETDSAIDEPICFLDNTDMLVTVANMIYMNYIQKEFNYENINLKLLEMIYEYITRLRGRSRKFEFVWKFKELLTKNLANSSFDIAKSSEKMGVSFDYMRHCFKTEIKSTPLEYLTSIRIRQAKRLLEHNRVYRISEIAEMCGFADQYYFSKTFKKLVGMSPRDYREKAANLINSEN